MSEDIGRNAICPCGSGRKFKNCHGATTARNWHLWAVVALFVVGFVAFLAFAVTDGKEPESPTRAASGAGKVTDYAVVPGLERVTDAGTRNQMVKHLNHTSCPCDCNMTIAECRNIDPTCSHSKDFLEQYLSANLEGASQLPAAPLSSH